MEAFSNILRFVNEIKLPTVMLFLLLLNALLENDLGSGKQPKFEIIHLKVLGKTDTMTATAATLCLRESFLLVGCLALKLIP